MSEGPKTVGRGNPPVEYQFKPGGKGGPGRPKGSGAKSAYEKLMNERIVVGTDGRGRPIRKTYRETINLQLVNKAAKGDLQAIRIIMDYEAKFAALATRNGPPPATMDELLKQATELEEKKKLTQNLCSMLDWGAELKKSGVMESSGRRLTLAPWVIEAIGDYREKHGAPRDTLPASGWKPNGSKTNT